MKKVYRRLAATLTLLVTLTGVALAQPSADLFLTGGPNIGNYPGYVTTGSYNVTFSNATGITLMDSSFMIVLSLPNGFEFDATYPGIPAGWGYVRTGLTSVNLIPTVNVSGVTPDNFVSFFVPMKTTQAVANQTYLGQIQRLIPVYQDPDQTNNTPTGTVSVLNVPLPVSFTHFDAQAGGCKTTISWATGQERNNKYFSVERSLDGIAFESIGRVDAKGTNTEGGAYSFTDESPANGKSFYRVAQYDMDGKFTTTNTLPVVINCGDNRIELFPNPSSEVVNVKGLSGKNTIRIINIAGQEVARSFSENTAQQSVKVSGLAAGTYHVQVVKNNEIIFNGKFVKVD